MGVEGYSASAQLRPISPADLADKADAPVLLIHGTKDTVVPIEPKRNDGKRAERVPASRSNS